MVSSMALSRVGANAILLGPGSLTDDKVRLLKTLDCKMIIYDPQMNGSQTKQLIEGITQLIEHNVNNDMDKPILVSMNVVSEELENVECNSYDNLLESGKSQDQKKITEAQKEVQFDDPLVALFTSGSSGQPKVVQLTHFSFVNIFVPTVQNMHLSSKVQWEIFYYDRPFSWISGCVFLQVALFANCKPISVPSELALSECKRNANAVFEIWENEKCDICILGVALIHKLYTDQLYLKYDFSSIKMLTIGGQRYSFDLVRKIFAMFPSVKVHILYGLTESLKNVSCVVTNDDLKDETFAKLSPAPGVEVKIVDQEERVVTRGCTGEICIRNASVFLEYLGNPKATKQAKSPTGWLRTGDIGTMYDDGKIEVLGRKTEMIKRACLKIFPAEIEKVLLQHPKVAEAVVFGVPDERLHEEIGACVALQGSNEGSDTEATSQLEELEEWCRRQLPQGPDGLSLTPKYFISMRKIPYTTTGKVFTRETKETALKLIYSGTLNENKGHIL